jgi:hypothetical protein
MEGGGTQLRAGFRDGSSSPGSVEKGAHRGYTGCNYHNVLFDTGSNVSKLRTGRSTEGELIGPKERVVRVSTLQGREHRSTGREVRC